MNFTLVISNFVVGAYKPEFLLFLSQNISNSIS